MDKIDKKIAKELLLNSRIPLNRLARKIKVSREVVLYRLNRMIRGKVIKNLYTTVNTQAIGFLRYTCFFQLKNVTKEKEAEIFEFFVNHKAITYIGPLVGRWNFAFDMLAKDRSQLNEFIKAILSKFFQYIKKYVIIETTTEEEVYPNKLIGVKSSFKANPSTDKTFKLDSKDKKILRLLANNSRIDYVELAKEIGMSANAIRYKIREMERNGIISGYTIWLDFRKLGLRCYNLQIKVTNPDIENKLRAFIREDSRALYFYKYIGNENWDMDIGIIVEDELKLGEFLLELRDLFGEAVEFNDLYIILEERKPYPPAIVFE